MCPDVVSGDGGMTGSEGSTLPSSVVSVSLCEVGCTVTGADNW